MAYNSVAFKKSMLAWGTMSKKAPDEIMQEVKGMIGEHPEAAKQVGEWGKQITMMNQRLGDELDHVINAKDDKGRVEAGKKAMASVKQYQNFVSSTHLPAGVQAKLKNGLAELSRGLG